MWVPFKDYRHEDDSKQGYWSVFKAKTLAFCYLWQATKRIM